MFLRSGLVLGCTEFTLTRVVIIAVSLFLVIICSEFCGCDSDWWDIFLFFFLCIALLACSS